MSATGSESAIRKVGPPRPTEVNLACLAIFCASIVAVVMDRTSAAYAGRSYGRDAIVIAVMTVLVIWGLARRQNWLRCLLVAVYLVSDGVLVLAVISHGFAAVSLMMALHAAIVLLAAILMMLPASHAWFRR
jgi:hypothetical protein